ncbi:hypothetical protein VaNZ11_007096, partial [Volvox africanus]
MACGNRLLASGSRRRAGRLQSLASTLQGTDLRFSGHFIYSTLPECPVVGNPLRCTNRNRVMDWLAAQGAVEAADTSRLHIPPLRPHELELLESSDPLYSRPPEAVLDRQYVSWREEVSVLPDGRHLKQFWLVAAPGRGDCPDRLVVTAEDSHRRDRRYTYKALQEFGGFVFENGNCAKEWLDFIVGKLSRPAPRTVKITQTSRRRAPPNPGRRSHPFSRPLASPTSTSVSPLALPLVPGHHTSSSGGDSGATTGPSLPVPAHKASSLQENFGGSSGGGGGSSGGNSGGGGGGSSPTAVSLPASTKLGLPPACWDSQASGPVGHPPHAAAFAQELRQTEATSPSPSPQQHAQQQHQQQPQQIQVGEASPTAGGCAWAFPISPWVPQQQQQQQQQVWHRLASEDTPGLWTPRRTSTGALPGLRISETTSNGLERPDHTVSARQREQATVSPEGTQLRSPHPAETRLETHLELHFPGLSPLDATNGPVTSRRPRAAAAPCLPSDLQIAGQDHPMDEQDFAEPPSMDPVPEPVQPSPPPRQTQMHEPPPPPPLPPLPHDDLEEDEATRELTQWLLYGDDGNDDGGGAGDICPSDVPAATAQEVLGEPAGGPAASDAVAAAAAIAAPSWACMTEEDSVSCCRVFSPEPGDPADSPGLLAMMMDCCLVAPDPEPDFDPYTAPDVRAAFQRSSNGLLDWVTEVPDAETTAAFRFWAEQLAVFAAFHAALPSTATNMGISPLALKHTHLRAAAQPPMPDHAACDMDIDYPIQPSPPVGATAMRQAAAGPNT